ncbi:hypothetical protein [Marinobacter sp.]|uniref:hypothetical protein n=1 Tax=Marinobacter sp. TaxID=50741 RepID=UPI0019E52F5A|nr:hypothetical protein [Marinobacter sp.]MBE0487014.1 hypothetical protein [Marinobacter sp.]
MPSTSVKFRIKTLKRALLKAIRNSWYRAIRVPAGQLAWLLWQNLRFVSDRILSRRNGIRVLAGQTLVEVPPGYINQYVLDEDVSRKFMIWPGDWDQRTKPMTTHYRYGPMLDLWQHRDNLEDSDSYHDLMQRIKNEQPLERVNKSTLVNSPEKAREFLASQLQIFYSLASEGYKPELADDELNVAITRYGTMVKANGGRKRLIAAQIIGLESIPVRIAYIHKHWIDQHETKGLKRSDAIRQAISKARILARQPVQPG